MVEQEQSDTPSPFFTDGSCVIYNGDCSEVLLSFPDNSIDAVVTDPPYGLSFMGKRWDYDVPSIDVWVQCLRVLKPGGHLLAFAGTRTQHRMAVRIEDAGFEIRDMIAWVYGSGFPKSMDVSKAIDKAAGAEREVVGKKGGRNAYLRTDIRGGNYIGGTAGTFDGSAITAPATDSAKQWEGWGTALKPALEPITMARKPILGTVADNVQKHGTGALNINGARIDLGGDYKCKPNGRPSQTGLGDNYDPSKANQADTVGRWPANLIHDGSDEVVEQFPESNGSGNARKLKRGMRPDGDGWGMQDAVGDLRDAGTGSASRFFYTAKADSSERRGSKHPTVKPLDLMRYLVRLVCPIGSTVLDPFMGSGTTIEAARLENCKSIGIERETQYCSDAIKRIRQQVMFVG
jgi:DNA modification methylase